MNRIITIAITFAMLFTLNIVGNVIADETKPATMVAQPSASPANTAPEPPKFDPQSLIGEYNAGGWKGTFGEGRGCLVVEKVSAEGKVEGSFFLRTSGAGPGVPWYYNRDVQFTAKLEGNTLAFELRNMSAMLTVDGTSVAGPVNGQYRQIQVRFTRTNRKCSA